MTEPNINCTYTNISEIGIFTIQERCLVYRNGSKTEGYVLWNKNLREHVARNGQAALFDSEEQAKKIAKWLIQSTPLLFLEEEYKKVVNQMMENSDLIEPEHEFIQEEL